MRDRSVRDASRFVVAVCLVLFAPFSADGELPSTQDKHDVLVLHSYHPGYPWTDDIQDAIVDTLGDRTDVSLHVEYLDLIRHSGASHWDFLNRLLREKYGSSDVQFDLILVSDDRALDLALQQRDDLFLDVPIVFAGINDFNAERLAGREAVLGVTGMDSTTAIGETLDLAFRLEPDLERIAVVSGSRPTEQLQHESFVEAAEARRPSVAIENLQALSEDEMVDRLAHYGAETAVIYLSYLLSPSGTEYSYRDALRLVVENTSAMVLVTTDYLVRDGVVGGRVVDGYAQGVDASQLALRVLEGEDPESIPIQNPSETRYIFDDRAVSRFGIEDEALPDRSLIINRRPQHLIEQQRDRGIGPFAEDALFDSHGAVMLLIDAEGGTIVAANEAAYEFYGYTHLVGKNINTINALSAEETAEEMRSAELRRNNYFTFQHRLADGSIRDVAVYSYPVRLQETDLLFSIVFDISDELSAQEAGQRQIWIIVVILALLLVTTTTALLLSLKLFRQTKVTEKVLRTHLQVRNSLMLEVQHRTRNNIQVIMGLISLQSAFMETKETVEACERLTGRVSTIALAHHQLGLEQAASYVSMSSYIHGIVDRIFSESVVDEARPRCLLEISETDILLDIAVPCGLIVHELLISSLKLLHRPDPERRIHLQLFDVDSQTLRLVYRDTLPIHGGEATSDNEEELSKALIEQLAEHQLGGSIARDVSPQGGTTYEIEISRSGYKDRIPYENLDS